MIKKDKHAQTRISEIYITALEPEYENCYLGFTISYPDGRIENITMEYHQDEFEQAMALMMIRRERAIKELHTS
jgi:hypothetical protein